MLKSSGACLPADLWELRIPPSWGVSSVFSLIATPPVPAGPGEHREGASRASALSSRRSDSVDLRLGDAVQNLSCSPRRKLLCKSHGAPCDLMRGRVGAQHKKKSMSTTAVRIPGFCGLCIARCGSIAAVEDGRFTRFDPDPTHPTGQALCAKVQTALAEAHGPQSVAYTQSSPSTSAIGDSAPFLRRLMEGFGTPNLVWSLEMCGWGRGPRYAFGVASVATESGGGPMADIENSGWALALGLAHVIISPRLVRPRVRETAQPLLIFWPNSIFFVSYVIEGRVPWKS
jgi:hypothetical protein